MSLLVKIALGLIVLGLGAAICYSTVYMLGSCPFWGVMAFPFLLGMWIFGRVIGPR